MFDTHLCPNVPNLSNSAVVYSVPSQLDAEVEDRSGGRRWSQSLGIRSRKSDRSNRPQTGLTVLHRQDFASLQRSISISMENTRFGKATGRPPRSGCRVTSGCASVLGSREVCWGLSSPANPDASTISIYIYIYISHRCFKALLWRPQT